MSKKAEKESAKDAKLADAEQTKKTDDEPPSAEDQEDGLFDHDRHDDHDGDKGGCHCKCGCGGEDENDDDDLTEIEKKIRKEKKERCRARKEKRRKEREEEHLNELDQQLLDAIALGDKHIEEAYKRIETPIDLNVPPPMMDPLEQITKAAIRLGARVDPETGYLKGFVPVKPDDVIPHDDQDQFELEDACHKGCKCNKKKDEDEDDAEFDAIEEAISQMGDAVTDPKQKCTMCQFFVGKVNRMFSRAARNAPIFMEEHIDSSSDIKRASAAVTSFNALPPNEQVIVLAHVTASLIEQQAMQEDTDYKNQQQTSSTTTTTTKSKAKCPGDGCDGGEGGGDDGIGGIKEEVEKAEEKGMEEGIEKEKEKVEEKKGQLEPKEPITPVRPPNRKERSVMILTGEPPERGVTHALWWLANDMFLNIKPLVFHKFQELCSERVPGSYADFCQPLFAVYDDITLKLRMGTGWFDVCLSDSFCTEDLRPPSPNDSKGGITPAK